MYIYIYIYNQSTVPHYIWKMNPHRFISQVYFNI